jgi:hypothetical protein
MINPHLIWHYGRTFKGTFGRRRAVCNQLSIPQGYETNTGHRKIDLDDDFDQAYIDVVVASTIKILDSGRRLAVICVDKTLAEKWNHDTRNIGFHYGWVPGNSVPGDKIAILPSCTVPVVLRPRPAGGFWIVGDVCAKGFTEEDIGTELTNNWPEIDIY